MATRTFLTSQELDEAKIHLKKNDGLGFSRWLGEKLEARLSAHPNWRVTRPYRLGSWARGELGAKSDIDLLFLGDEEKVKSLVTDLQNDGIKIRYRVPADREDWTQNVESFDVLALLGAVPFYPEDQEPLMSQQQLILSRGAKYKRQLFQAMIRERRERARRYDSIANYLEPNLKYGPGGLRDLEQALMIFSLFASSIAGAAKVADQLRDYKIYLLKLRHYLHLHGANDILVSSMQAEMARFFGYAETQAFMSELEAALSEVSFCADWMVEAAFSSLAKREAVQKMKVHRLEDALRALKKNNSVLMQQHVRQKRVYSENQKRMGQVLVRYLNSNMSDGFIQAVFRSNLLAEIIPDLKRLKGHVQHDQYHRYSVDAHTLQAVREVLRVKKNPRRLGRLASLAQELTRDEWEVLIWTALYHDLGKGLQGDHSNEGAKIVKHQLISMGISLKLTAQVAWMVQNHLVLSGAAFRQNPHASATWAELFRRGVKGRRISKLALFTAIDIRATNPEAWNEWKERLLNDLTQALRSPKASRLSALLELAEKKKVKVSRDFIENLDPQVVESVPQFILLKDFLSLQKAMDDLFPLVVRNRQKETWIRFHARADRPGLFLFFTHQLHHAGLSVVEAFVQTYEEFGAYDWFKVKTAKPLTVLNSVLRKTISSSRIKPEQVQFAAIDVISQDDKIAILSFRGRDQRGALLAAAQALHDAGFEILSAKVHTWGRQIEDVFTVKKRTNFAEAFEKLNVIGQSDKTL